MSLVTEARHANRIVAKNNKNPSIHLDPLPRLVFVFSTFSCDCEDHTSEQTEYARIPKNHDTGPPKKSVQLVPKSRQNW